MFGQTFDTNDIAIIGLLVVLEGFLSIDNALVLGILAKRLPKAQRNKALSYGLIGAMVFRLIAVVAAAAFLLWTEISYGKAASAVVATIAALALLGAVAFSLRGREGWAFTLNAAAIVAAVAALFIALYPNVLPSTSVAAGTLTVTNASSTGYTLAVMSWVAVIFTPVVLAYQAWTYWVFRQRISASHIPVVSASAVPPRGGVTPTPV